jgi:hypothetical protein
VSIKRTDLIDRLVEEYGEERRDAITRYVQSIPDSQLMSSTEMLSGLPGEDPDIQPIIDRFPEWQAELIQQSPMLGNIDGRPDPRTSMYRSHNRGRAIGSFSAMIVEYADRKVRDATEEYLAAGDAKPTPPPGERHSMYWPAASRVRSVMFDENAVTPRTRMQIINEQIQQVVDSPWGIAMTTLGSTPGGSTLVAGMESQADEWTVGDRTTVPSGILDLESYTNDVLFRFEGMRQNEVQAAVRGLAPEDLVSFQIRMLHAGFYDENTGMPVLGEFTTADRSAVQLMVADAIVNYAGMSLGQMFDERERQGLRGIREKYSLQDMDADGVTDGDAMQVMTLTSDQTFADLIDQVAQQLMGRDADPQVRAQMVEEFKKRERASKYALLQAQTMGAPADIADELDAFIESLAQGESGADGYGAVNTDSGARGRYQFMPETWARWAPVAGLPSNAPMTPANQDLVARTLALHYYNTFGNWRDVYIAWYGGEGKVGARQSVLDAAQTSGRNRYPSINQYANTYMERMNGILQRKQEELGGMINPETGVLEIEQFDPQSEAERALRASQRSDVLSFGFSNQMREFFSLLGGVTPYG